MILMWIIMMTVATLPMSTLLSAAFETLAASQERSIVEHVHAVRVQGPVVALARVARLAGHFDKAVVERQIMAYAVLPSGEALAVIGEFVHYEITDAA